jgi:hypothetical protein
VFRNKYPFSLRGGEEKVFLQRNFLFCQSRKFARFLSKRIVGPVGNGNLHGGKRIRSTQIKGDSAGFINNFQIFSDSSSRKNQGVVKWNKKSAIGWQYQVGHQEQ